MLTTPNKGLKKPQDTDNADLKIFVGDNMDIIDTELSSRKGGELESFLVYQTTAQAIPSQVWTHVNFQTTMFDKANGWQSATGKYKIQNAGVYQITGSVNWNNTTTGTRSVMELRKNGSSLVWMTQEHAGAGKDFSATGVATVELAVNDLIEIWIWHDAPTSMDTVLINNGSGGISASTFFSAVKQGG